MDELAMRAAALAEACRFRSENLLILARDLLADLMELTEGNDDNVSTFGGCDDEDEL